jgi:hypothetical protein
VRNTGVLMGNGINRSQYYKRLARQREKLLAHLASIVLQLHMASGSMSSIERVVVVAKRVERSMRIYQSLALLEEL